MRYDLFNPNVSAKDLETVLRADLAKERSPGVLRDLAVVLSWLGQGDEALTLLKEAEMAVTGHAKTEFLVGRASIAARTGNLDEWKRTVQSFSEIELQAPDEFSLNVWATLKTGDWKRGWGEWRHNQIWNSRQAALRGIEFIWTGAEIPGKRLLVYSEHGHGDVFFALKFLPEIKRRSKAYVILEVRESIFDLAVQSKDLLGCDEIRPLFPPDETWSFEERFLRKRAVPVIEKDYDYHVGCMDALAVMGIAPEDALEQPAIWLKSSKTDLCGAKTGLCWHGNRSHMTDSRRSIPEELLHSFNFPYVSLQQEALEAKNWAETAAVINGLDLVVSVDASQAHLAGAMGKPVYLLLSKISEWRWLYDVETHPWYPSMIILRQNEAWKWEEVIERVNKLVGSDSI